MKAAAGCDVRRPPFTEATRSSQHANKRRSDQALRQPNLTVRRAQGGDVAKRKGHDSIRRILQWE